MSRIVYSTSLRKNLNRSLGRKPFYRRPGPWAGVILSNAVLALCLYGKVPLDSLWRLLPQAKATPRPSLAQTPVEAAAALSPAQALVEAARVEPPKARPDPREARAAAWISKRYYIAKEAADHIAREAFKAAKIHKVDPLLMLAIMGVESRYNPLAESSVGAMGLTQVLPEFHPDKVAVISRREGHILNISDNIEFGTRTFAEYSRRFKGDSTLALQQYNGSLDDPRRAYSRKVLALRAQMAKGVG